MEAAFEHTRKPSLHFAVLSFLCLLYIPFSGAYGLWDPWETHYGEVARQMAARGDWISLWWPGSPQDPASGVFFSKPVLTFWLMALSLKAFGLGHADPRFFNEMTVGWRAEWALRLPFVLLGIVGVWAAYLLVERVASRRAALWTALVLATSTQWALIARQAMTDMAFVAPMTVATVYAALALLPQAEPFSPTTTLPRRSVRFLSQDLSWPHDRAFYGFLALFVGFVLPQLVVNVAQLKSFSITLRGQGFRVLGPLAMLPFAVLFVGTLYACARVQNRRAIYLATAYVLCGVATLAKGPAGLGMPVLTIGMFLFLSGRLSEVLGERQTEAPSGLLLKLPEPIRELWSYKGGLELSRGAALFLCVAGPWFAAMLARHGQPFWIELIGDNYVHRAQGRHGDRGTFEYYIEQIALGMFPWTGIVAAGSVWTARVLRKNHSTKSSKTALRRELSILCFAWFAVDFGIVTLVNTKFHHYILPALPPLAIFAGLFLDDLCEVASDWIRNRQRALLFLVGVPLTYLAGRDLSNFPARIGWLFNYDYVNVPNVGRPWPVVSLYGNRYEYGSLLWIFVGLATVAVALFAFVLPASMSDQDPQPVESSTKPKRRVWMWCLAGLLVAALCVLGNAFAPSPEQVVAYSSSKLPPATVFPPRLAWAFLVPAGLCVAFLCAVLWRLKRSFQLSTRTARRVAWGAGLCVAVAIVWTNFVLNRFLVDISPHWSQKHVFATYFRLRQGPHEPVIAWMMYWRGENFYTCNQIYDHRVEPGEKTVFLGDRNTEKLQEYIRNHSGRRMFFLIERHRLESLRGLLPEPSRPTLEVVDDTNNKVYLVRAQL